MGKACIFSLFEKREPKTFIEFSYPIPSDGGRDALRKYASGIFLAKAGSKLCLRPGPKGKPPPYINTFSLLPHRPI